MSDCKQIDQVTHEKWATMSESLRSLMAKEQHNSRQKSNHERIAQVAHGNRVTVSGLLMSLMKKERMSKSLVFLNELLIRSFAHKNKWFPKKIRIKSYFTFLKVFFSKLTNFPYFWIRISEIFSFRIRLAKMTVLKFKYVTSSAYLTIFESQPKEN